MLLPELQDKHGDFQYIACMNQRYHQSREWLWGRFDMAIRITVSVAVGISAVTCFSGPLWLSALCTIIGLAAALSVSIAPFSDWQKHYRELFRRWTDLRADIEELQTKATEPISQDRLADCVDRYLSLNNRRHQIESEEPAPNEDALLKAQQDENYSRYKVRTYEEACKVIAERRANQPAAK